MSEWVLGGSYTHEEPKRFHQGVQFGTFSPDEIRRLSVAHVSDTTVRMGGLHKGGVTDPSMGPSHWSVLCSSDGRSDCPGHFGHIELGQPVFNVEFLPIQLKLMRCFCAYCGHVLLPSSDWPSPVSHRSFPAYLSLISTRTLKRSPVCLSVEEWAWRTKYFGARAYTPWSTLSLIHKVSDPRTSSKLQTLYETFRQSLYDPVEWAWRIAHVPKKEWYGYRSTEDIWSSWSPTKQNAHRESYEAMCRTRTKKVSPYCGQVQPLWEVDPSSAQSSLRLTVLLQMEDLESFKEGTWKLPESQVFTVFRVYAMLQYLEQHERSSLKRLGFDLSHTSIPGMMWNPLIVPAFCTRHTTNKTDDDLTVRLKGIRRANSKVDPMKEINITTYRYGTQTHADPQVVLMNVSVPLQRTKKGSRKRVQPEDHFDIWLKLQLLIANYQNHKGSARELSFGKKRLENLRQRVGRGKEGFPRKSCIRKRHDFNARTVLAPNSRIAHVRDLGVPLFVCRICTFPEVVTKWNVERLTEHVRHGPEGYPGAVSIKIPSEERPNTYELIHLDSVNRGKIRLRLGWVVNRHLVKGDIVSFLRNPVLHRFGYLAHRVVPIRERVFRVHLSRVKGYNADFDGDEGSISVPQGPEEVAELRWLYAVEWNIMRDGHPLLVFHQHARAFLYFASLPETVIPHEVAVHVLSRSRMWRHQEPSVSLPEGPVSGRILLSQLWPQTFSIPQVIEDGLLCTVLDQETFDVNGMNGLIAMYWHEYGGTACADFVSDVYETGYTFLEFYGMTVSYRDCCLPSTSPLIERLHGIYEWCEKQPTEDVVASAVLERCREWHASEVQRLLLHGRGVHQEGGRIVNDLWQIPRNGLVDMVLSGAKGSKVNLNQFVRGGVVGQQRNHKGLPFDFTHMYSSDRLSSTGYVRNGFMDGLNISECFAHWRNGRQAIADVVIETKRTGYAHRRISKNLEDIIVDRFGSARTGSGLIIDSVYGGDAMDADFLRELPLPHVDQLEIWSRESTPNQYVQWWNRIGQVKRVSVIFDMKHVLHGLSPRESECVLFSADEVQMMQEQILSLWKTCPHYVPPSVRLYISLHLPWVFQQTTPIHGPVYWSTVRHWVSLKECLHQRWHLARCPPGTLVGLRAAQSIGEPVTQKQLSNVHHIGSQAAITSGVDRLNELINAIDHPSTPLIQLATKEANRCPIQTEHYVTFTIEQQPIFTPEQCERLALFPHNEAKQSQPWFQPDTYYTTLLHIKACDAPVTTFDLVCMYHRVFPQAHWAYGETWIVYSIDRMSFPKWHSDPLDIQSLHVYDTIRSMCVYGHEGVHIVEQTDEHHWVVYGATSLSEVLSLPEVQLHETFSNNIHEMAQIFGIDAAVESIVREMTHVTKEGGVRICERHIRLLANYMTRDGVIRPMTFNGFTNGTVLQKASYEQTVKTMVQSALCGEYDHGFNMSAALITGNLIPSGTAVISTKERIHMSFPPTYTQYTLRSIKACEGRVFDLLWSSEETERQMEAIHKKLRPPSTPPPSEHEPVIEQELDSLPSLTFVPFCYRS
jgi:DNA-directed RNA polymerase beta' subunit